MCYCNHCTDDLLCAVSFIQNTSTDETHTVEAREEHTLVLAVPLPENGRWSLESTAACLAVEFGDVEGEGVG